MRAVLLWLGLLVCLGAWADSERTVDRDPAGRIVRVQDLRDGVPIWEVTYDPESGLPLTETTFEGGQPVETADLEFTNRVLSRRTVRSATGAASFTDTLRRWPDGSLRRLERDGAEPIAEAAWQYGEHGTLARVWSADEDLHSRGEHRETVFGAHTTEETVAAVAQLVSSRVTESTDGGTRETRTDAATQRVESRNFDAKGRVLDEVVTVKGAAFSTRHWSYDAQGRVTLLSSQADGPAEVWSYVYLDDGVTASLTRGGTLVREERQRDGEKTEVRLYDRGELFLVETWAGGKRTRETYYQKGQVVRERSP
jgi:hypothetical protein